MTGYYYHGFGYDFSTGGITSIYEKNEDGNFNDTGYELFEFDIIGNLDISNKLEPIEHVIYYQGETWRHLNKARFKAIYTIQSFLDIVTPSVSRQKVTISRKVTNSRYF